jgi:hypothetical protein
VGASETLGRYLVQLALERGYEVVGVCRPKTVKKLAGFEGRMAILTGRTDDRHLIARAVAGCDGVLTVIAPWDATATVQAVLDFAAPGARLIFSSGWHIRRDNRDVYPRTFLAGVRLVGWLAKALRLADLDDQVEACRRIFASESRWTVVRGSKLEEGESQGLPVWSRHVGDPILASNRTRRIDFALFMVEALHEDALIQEAPAIAASRRGGSLL